MILLVADGITCTISTYVIPDTPQLTPSHHHPSPTMSSDPPTKRRNIGVRSSFYRVLNDTTALLKPPSKSTSNQLLATSAPSAGSPGLGANKRNWSQSWTGLEAAVKNLHLTTKIFPPLQSVIGTLASSVEYVQVNVSFKAYQLRANRSGYLDSY